MMIPNRNLLLLFQASALVIIPLLLEVSWSRQILGISQSQDVLPALHTDDERLNSTSGSEPVHQSDAEPSLQIAWLMSFPNSGTSYTSHFIRKATGTKTATNYAELRLSRQVLLGHESKESIPVFSDQPTGPFWTDGNETDLESGFVLTKVRVNRLFPHRLDSPFEQEYAQVAMMSS